MGGHRSGASNFGARLKELREASNLSQQQLADAAGMNVFGVAKLEQGKREPSWATVQALAAALGVDCTVFAAEAKSPASDPEKSVTKKPKGKK